MRIMADLLNGYASRIRLQTDCRSEPRNGSNSDATFRIQEAMREGGDRDNLFHPVLGLFTVRTHLYDQRLDILQRCRTRQTSRT
jgi:glucan phosphoethanolaminetransferase (alkaline phosphatase superfamily)